MTAYTRGLHEIGDGLFAYLQPDGRWGYSNAGLVTAEESSLLVDTPRRTAHKFRRSMRQAGSVQRAHSAP